METLLGGIAGIAIGSALIFAHHVIRWRIKFGEWGF